jgi:hypothetical protein
MRWLQCVILFCKLEHEVFQEVYEFLDIGLRDIFYSLIKVMSLESHAKYQMLYVPIIQHEYYSLYH